MVAIGPHSPITSCSKPRNPNRSSRLDSLISPNTDSNTVFRNALIASPVSEWSLRFTRPMALRSFCGRPCDDLGPWHCCCRLVGDVGIWLTLLARFDVGDVAVACIHSALPWQLAYVGLDSLQYGEQVHRIAGLVAGANAHDHLVVTICCGHRVVALNPALSSLDDATFWIGELALGLGFWVFSRTGGQ